MPALTLSGNEVTDLARRIGYSLGTSAAGQMLDGLTLPGGVGIRRAATNLFRRGQCDATTDYTPASGTTVVVDPTVSLGFSPQSIKVTTDGSAGQQGIFIVTATGQAAVPGVNGVGSIRFKGVAGQSYVCALRWRNTDATLTQGGNVIFTADGSVQLLGDAIGGVATLAALAVAAGKTGDRLELRVFINGTRAESFWVGHGMLEKGQSVVAPYVATSGGATATHAAGRVQAPASLLNATQGWIAMRVRMGWNATDSVEGGAPFAFQWFTSTNERIGLFFRAGGTRLWTLRRFAGGAGTDALSAADSFNAGDLRTVIVKWTAAQIGVSVNGGAFSLAANSSIPALVAPTFEILSDGSGGTQFDSDVLWFACGTGTVTDGNASAINSLWDMRTQTNRRLMPWDFPPASLCSMTYDPRDDAAEFFRGAPGIPLIGGVS